MTQTRRRERVRAFLASPLGRPTAAVTALCGLATLWAFSFPGGPSTAPFVLLTFGWLGIGSYWTLRLVAAAVTGGREGLRRHWIRWGLPPAIVVSVAALVLISAPFAVRYQLSRGDMDGLARDAMAGRSVDGVHSAGLFPVGRVERYEGGVRFVVHDCMFDTCGFAYSEDGWPPNLGGEDSYVRLGDGWFVWQESW